MKRSLILSHEKDEGGHLMNYTMKVKAEGDETNNSQETSHKKSKGSSLPKFNSEETITIDSDNDEEATSATNVSSSVLHSKRGRGRGRPRGRPRGRGRRSTGRVVGRGLNTKSTSLIFSDEEDEDGDLIDIDTIIKNLDGKGDRENNSQETSSRTTSEKCSLTKFNSEEVIIIDSEDTEDSSATNVPSLVSHSEALWSSTGRPISSVKASTLKSNTTENEKKPISNTNCISNNSSEPVKQLVENNCATSNTSKAPLIERKQEDSYIKRNKFKRGATPLCDAIMKEYTKRQKELKLKGISDSSKSESFKLKEMLQEMKLKNVEGNKLIRDNESGNSKHNNSEKNVLIKFEPRPDLSQETAKVIAPQDQKPSKNKAFPIFVKTDIKHPVSVTIKDEIKSNDSCHPLTNIPIKIENGHSLAFEDSKSIINQGKEEDQIYIADKSTFSNSSNIVKPSVVKQTSPLIENLISNPPSGEVHLSARDPANASNVASRLTLIADNISSLLNCDGMDPEAHKLLQATQKMLQQKNEQLLANSKELCRIKSEIPDHLIKNDGACLVNSCKNDANTRITNKLNSPKRCDGCRMFDNISEPLYLKEKNTFVMDYFKSYQEVFDHQIFQVAIPLLSEILLIFMDNLMECLHRMKNAHSVTILELRQQEVQLAYQTFVNVVMSFGKKFFDQFDSIAQKIVKTKTPKAIMTTLIYFITNTLLSKTPKYKGQVHKVLVVLIMISKIYKYYNFLFLEVLEAPNNIFEEELTILVKIIKYFYDRKFIAVPSDNVFKLWSEHFENILDINSSDDSLINELVAKLNIPYSIDKFRHQCNYERNIFQASKNIPPYHHPTELNRSSSYSTNIAAQFFEALQTERDYNSQRIEEKLDQILSYLSDNKIREQHISSTQFPSRQSHNVNSTNYKSQSSSTIPSNSGLDNLFSFYLNARKKVNTVPFEFNGSGYQSTLRESSQSNNQIPVETIPHLEDIKEELEEYNKTIQSASIKTDGAAIISELLDSDVKEVTPVIKKEDCGYIYV